MDKSKNIGIYAICNLKNKKYYIGQSRNITKRHAEHIRDLNNGKHHNIHLQRAWAQYGEESFVFDILEYCNLEDLDEREKYWIEQYDAQRSGYNIRPGGNSCSGWHPTKVSKRTPEVTARIAEKVKMHYASHVHPQSKAVVCITTGEYFESASWAQRTYPHIDHSSIHKCCKGKSSYCGKDNFGDKLVWVYATDYETMSDEEISDRLSKGTDRRVVWNLSPVICLNTGEIFPSISEASRIYKTRSIASCLAGKCKTAGKDPTTGEPLKWEYVA